MERLKKFLMTYLVASGRNKMCTSCLKAMPLPIRPPSSHWHSWRITLGESPVTIYIWGLRALAVNQNTEVVPGWCREQLVDAQGRSHLHFQSVLPHYLCHRATSSTVAFLCVDFFPHPLWFPPPIWPFVCHRCPLERQLGRHITWDQTFWWTEVQWSPRFFLQIFCYSWKVQRQELKCLRGPLYTKGDSCNIMVQQRIKLAKYIFAQTTPLGAVNLPNIL